MQHLYVFTCGLLAQKVSATEGPRLGSVAQVPATMSKFEPIVSFLGLQLWTNSMYWAKRDALLLLGTFNKESRRGTQVVSARVLLPPANLWDMVPCRLDLECLRRRRSAATNRLRVKVLRQHQQKEEES